MVGTKMTGKRKCNATTATPERQKLNKRLTRENSNVDLSEDSNEAPSQKENDHELPIGKGSDEIGGKVTAVFESVTETPTHRRSARIQKVLSEKEQNSANISTPKSTRKSRETPKSKRRFSNQDASEKQIIEARLPKREIVHHEDGQIVPAADCQVEDPEAAKQVKGTLKLFNTYYLRFVHEEEERCRKEDKEKSSSKKKKNDEPRKSRRPDLKAITQMRADRKMLHDEKILGPVHGVSVGDHFFSRCEMMAVGLHCHWLAGIDYIGSAYKKSMKCTLPVASSIVLSGIYEDDVDNSTEVVYTGSGGNDLLGNKRQIADQVMEKGNLALKNSMEQGLPVRLIRGHKTKGSYTGKVYTYDGLYKVTKFWAEKGISGFTVYKFSLHRLEGQSVLTTEQVHFVSGQVPSNPSDLKGLVCADISNGQENIPVPASNLVDSNPAPPDFRYLARNEVSKGVEKPRAAKGCGCKGECNDVSKCSCARLNGNKFPYVTKNGGRLVEPMDVVFECGPHCGCGPSCSNRVTQRGLYYRLEVFKTANKGWAVRTWDTIPAGAPVCEYTGILMRTEDADDIADNQYLFELDCLQTIKGVGGRQRRDLSNGKACNAYEDALKDVPEQPEYCIDAGNCGSVARFINHSCEPNLFVQCVVNEHHDLSQPRIWFYAAETIHPLQELCYDYGYELGSVVKDGKEKVLPCYCGAHGCRKRLH